MKTCMLLAAAILVGCLTGATAKAQSSSMLYRRFPQGNPSIAVSLIEIPQPEPIQLHDLINVEIDERTIQLANARNNRRRQFSYELNLDDFVVLLSALRLRADQGIRTDQPGIDIETLTNQQSTSQLTRNDRLNFSIQVEVAEVKPNGNLVIEGYKTIAANNEVSTYKISGIVSSKDINATTRSVKSDRIHRSKVELIQVGPTRDTIKRGWIARFIDMFRMF